MDVCDSVENLRDAKGAEAVTGCSSSATAMR